MTVFLSNDFRACTNIAFNAEHVSLIEERVQSLFAFIYKL